MHYVYELEKKDEKTGRIKTVWSHSKYIEGWKHTGKTRNNTPDNGQLKF